MLRPADDLRETTFGCEVMTEQMAEDKAHTVSIGRQPVFDQNGRVWGYDLFCVGDRGELGGAYRSH